MRRSLFDILGPDVVDATVLDLYAGAGGLGVEALSRGAARCDFVDRDRRCVAVIQANLALLRESEGAPLSTVDCAPVESWLRRHQGRLAAYDLIMLDPPYGEPGLENVLSYLARPAALGADALVVLEERADREVVPPAGLQAVRRVSHGDSALTFIRAAS